MVGRYVAAGAAGGSGDHGWTISWHEELLKEKDELLKKKDAKKKARRSAGKIGGCRDQCTWAHGG